MRVAVIGGGVVGLCSAYALDRAGCEVVLLERGALGDGASRGNTGWVSPTLSTPLASPGTLRMGLRSALDPRGALVIRPGLDTSWLRWLNGFRVASSRERFRRGVKALLDLNARTFDELDGYAAAGVEFEMHEGGIVVCATSEKGISWFAPVFEDLVSLGFAGGIERLDPVAARALEPALSDEVQHVVRTTVDRYVRPESLMAGLAAALRARGADLREHAAVADLAPLGAQGWAVVAGGERIIADAVVVATGADAPKLLGPFGLRLPIVPAKGYSITLRGEGTAPRHALYLCEPKIGISGYDDGVRIAGVFELPGRSLDADPRRVGIVVEDALHFLRDFRPAAGESLREGWAGFRPATPDSLPLLGAVRDHPGLYLAAGHGMLGVTLAPATGAVIADLVTGTPAPAWLEPMRPDRRF